MATHFVPADKLDSLRQDLVKNVGSSTSTEQIVQIVNAYADQSAASRPIEHLDEINQLFRCDGSVHDFYRGLEAANSEFSAACLKKLGQMSPLSLGVVFEQIKRGARMNLKEVFEMEYKISQGFMRHTEFFEGVRALLIDKDKTPKWKHASVLDVTQQEINWFFDQPDTLNLDISKYSPQ